MSSVGKGTCPAFWSWKRYLLITVVGIGVLCTLGWYAWSYRQIHSEDGPLFLKVVADHAQHMQAPPVAYPDGPPKVRALNGVRLFWSEAVEDIRTALNNHPAASAGAQARVKELQSLAQNVLDLVEPLLADPSALEAREWSTLVEEIQDLEARFYDQISTLQR